MAKIAKVPTEADQAEALAAAALLVEWYASTDAPAHGHDTSSGWLGDLTRWARTLSYLRDQAEAQRGRVAVR